MKHACYPLPKQSRCIINKWLLHIRSSNNYKNPMLMQPNHVIIYWHVLCLIYTNAYGEYDLGRFIWFIYSSSSNVYISLHQNLPMSIDFQSYYEFLLRADPTSVEFEQVICSLVINMIILRYLPTNLTLVSNKHFYVELNSLTSQINYPIVF